MKNLIIALLLLCSYSLSTFAAENFLPPFAANYKLYSRGFLIGEGSRRLYQQQDGKMVFEGKILPAGVAILFYDSKIEERSIFTLDNGKIRPLEYTLDRGPKKPKHVHLTFDWQNNIVKSVVGKTWELPIQNGTLDDQLYQIVLMLDLQQGKRQLSYIVADDDKKIKIYTPTYVGKERVKTGIGELETLKYERLSSDKKRRTTLWCAPALHYLPVQVEHLEKGDVMTMILQTVAGLPK